MIDAVDLAAIFQAGEQLISTSQVYNDILHYEPIEKIMT